MLLQHDDSTTNIGLVLLLLLLLLVQVKTNYPPMRRSCMTTNKNLLGFSKCFFAVKNEHIAKNTQRMCLDQSLAYKYQSPVSHYRSHYHSKSKLRSLNLAIRSAKVLDQNLGLSTYLDRS